MFEDLAAEEQRPLLERWFAPGEPYVVARWIWLRALGLIFFSAFYSLYFQIHGLIGPRGLLPASGLLASDRALDVIVWTGLIASLAIVINIWPRIAIAIAGIAFFSFVMSAQDFSGYQSDSMLLEASLLSLFLGGKEPPSRASLFMMRWLWLRIYVESGVVKILSGEPQWRNLTAMDKYYENGPLPTWIGWYVQQWPHGFHAFTAGATLVIELLVAWLVLFPQPAKRICFLITTPLQIGIILTANYAFLNYLVLVLGFLLVHDRGAPVSARARVPFAQVVVLPSLFAISIMMFLLPLPILSLIAPFRIINNYGLFAIMTRARYEIEFQGSNDGVRWIAYPFRYKPQNVFEAPRIFAPYQPRFDWNLWFASLGTVSENRWVMNTEVRLLENSPQVLELFRSNPFPTRPPRSVRTIVWRYWFTTTEERRKTGAWWNRKYVGPYSPAAIQSGGGIAFE